MVRSDEAHDSGAAGGSGVLLALVFGCRCWWKLNQLDNWLRLEAGRDSDFLLDGAAVAAVDSTIRSKRMAKQRSNRKIGRNSDDLEPGRVNVADVLDVVDIAVVIIPGSREEITLIFSFLLLFFFRFQRLRFFVSRLPMRTCTERGNKTKQNKKDTRELALNCSWPPCLYSTKSRSLFKLHEREVER